MGFSSLDDFISEVTTGGKFWRQEFNKLTGVAATAGRCYDLSLANGNPVQNLYAGTNLAFVATSDKAYFHSNANATSRRGAYIVRGQGGTFTKVENNFGYLTFTYNGKTSVGWIPLSDIKFS